DQQNDHPEREDVRVRHAELAHHPLRVAVELGELTVEEAYGESEHGVDGDRAEELKLSGARHCARCGSDFTGHEIQPAMSLRSADPSKGRYRREALEARSRENRCMSSPSVIDLSRTDLSRTDPARRRMLTAARFALHL